MAHKVGDRVKVRGFHATIVGRSMTGNSVNFTVQPDTMIVPSGALRSVEPTDNTPLLHKIIELDGEGYDPLGRDSIGETSGVREGLSSDR